MRYLSMIGASLLLLLVGLVVALPRCGSAQAKTNLQPGEKAVGLIFCDGFESGDSSAWGSDDCSSVLSMPVAVADDE